MAGHFAGALIQEAVTRASSFLFSKREEKASKEHNIERLEMAVTDLNFVLQEFAKLRIIDISQLRHMCEFKRACIEGADLLSKHKHQADTVVDHQQVVVSQGVTHSSSLGPTTHARNSSFSISSLVGMKKEECLSPSDVRRFERFAERAWEFLRYVQSSSSLRHPTFCSPLLRHLLEGKSLEYRMVQGTQVHYFRLYSVSSEDRGLEALIWYRYQDCKVPENNFDIKVMLQVSESTNIVGIADKCLQSVRSSQLKLPAQSARKRLNLLADLRDTFVPDHDSLKACLTKSYSLLARFFRQDPFCCKSNGYIPSANNGITSGLSHLFPEEVIYFSFDCRISAVGASSRKVKRNATSGWRPPLQASVSFWPHDDSGLKYSQQSLTVETVGDNYEEIRYASVEQVAEMAVSRAISCFSRQPDLTSYKISWRSVHGRAQFDVRRPTTEEEDVPETSSRYNTRSNAKRRRS